MTARLLLLTDGARSHHPLWTVMEAAIDAGVRQVVLREHGDPDRRLLATRLANLLGEVGGRLILAVRDVAPAWWQGAYHLAAAARPVDRAVFGRSCHNAAELAAAQAEGAAHVTVSPVYPTSSKPGYGLALGVAGLGALCAKAVVPVYALGGIDTPARIRECLGAGAHGVAVMGAIMRSRDPGVVAARLVEAAR
ncbi:thiamine phosphate synthase [Actinorhabdospora filicis]|uniref:Thiamine phosphate synthase n=1 Tax=Actinorhabdospora filicis TaxID=1785913 RepID=A0A9W6SS37_9ACTN|nr:thiamine phosphate synthase [Actinorhabdospora filicis]GLZ80940.1 thiamine phosphate synthase [Actinorhabdospora filicis]